MVPVLWAVLGLMGSFIHPPNLAGDILSMRALGTLSLIFGVYVFWKHGGARVTGAGLYCLSMSVYVGFSSIWWAAQPDLSSTMHTATLTGWWSTYAMWVLFWRSSEPYTPNTSARDRALDFSQLVPWATTNWVILVGAVGAVVGAGTAALGMGNATQFALGGLVLVVAGIMMQSRFPKTIAMRLALASLIVAIFFSAYSGGRGRLNVVALGLVAVVLASSQVHTRWLKGLVIGAAPPAAWLLVVLRSRLGVVETGEAYNGLGSVVNPLRDFGNLVAVGRSGWFDPVGIDPFVATFLFWVPRNLWPGKPEGFGRQLVGVLMPDLLTTNQSLAALASAEWYFAFGWIGVLAMVPALGLFVRTLDKIHLGQTRALTRQDVLKQATIVLLVATIPTLAWVGTYTYVSRAGQQLLLIAFVALPWAWKRQGYNGLEAGGQRYGNELDSAGDRESR